MVQRWARKLRVCEGPSNAPRAVAPTNGHVFFEVIAGVLSANSHVFFEVIARVPVQTAMCSLRLLPEFPMQGPGDMRLVALCEIDYGVFLVYQELRKRRRIYNAVPRRITSFMACVKGHRAPA